MIMSKVTIQKKHSFSSSLNAFSTRINDEYHAYSQAIVTVLSSGIYLILITDRVGMIRASR